MAACPGLKVSSGRPGGGDMDRTNGIGQPISPEVPNHLGALGIEFAWALVELAPDGILVTDDVEELDAAIQEIRTAVFMTTGTDSETTNS